MRPKIKLLLQKTTSSISKRILVAFIATVCLTASAFASGDEANEKAANNLKREYKNATDVRWEVTDKYIKATFYWNDQHLQVFYNKDGETIAQGKLIQVKNLPLAGQQYLQDNYASYMVTEAVELTTPETGLCYYVRVEKGKVNKILQISTEGAVSLFRP